MNKIIVSVQNVSKSFGGRKVVYKLSLSVAYGEVFGLLGHNHKNHAEQCEKKGSTHMVLAPVLLFL